MKKLFSAVLLLLTLVGNSNAQYMNASGQNYINRFSVAPAFAGFNGNHEGWLGYRSFMTGIDGAEKLLSADVNGNIGGNMGYGVSIINEKYGNFNNLFAAITYAYHLQLSGDANLSFAISPAIIRSSYDLAKATTYSATVDPVLANEAGLSGTGFDAGFSLLFNIKGLYFSVNIPRLICQDLKFQNGIANYDRTFYGTISYNIEASDKWEIEPIADVIYAMKGGLDWRGSLVAKYNKRAWLQLSYSSEKWLGIGAGFSATNRIAVNYKYEMGTSDLAKSINGIHEISVGFLISKSKEYKKPTVFFDENQDNSSVDNKKDNKLAKELQQEIEKRESEIKRLEDMIKAAQKEGSLSSNSSNPKSETVEVVEQETNPTPLQINNNVPPADPRPDPRVWGKPQPMNNIVFLGQNMLSHSSYAGIDTYVKLMKGEGITTKDFKNKKLLIIVMTDGRGSDAYNKTLAQQRAKAIKDYMITQGIDASRIEVKPVGAVGVGNTPEDRFNNNKVMACWSIKDF